MDGVLNFKFPPNYDTTTPDNNIKKVVVVSSDDALGVTGRMMEYHKVTVTITDVDEDGRISLSALQPQVGVALTATLTDQDDADTDTAGVQLNDIKYRWEQSSTMDGPWTLVSGATSAEYMPAKDVVGMYLRAMATYTDKHGDDKTAMAVSAHAVRAEPAGTNASPVFPGTATGREVDENSAPGTAVGKPVTAGDAGDILTYTLTGSDDDDDDALYRIDRATGQIMVGPRTVLNREALETPFQHTVTVTATDPWGIAIEDETISGFDREVTITIDNVNEAPRATGGVTKNEHQENMTDDDNTVDVNETVFISTYTVMDVDANDIIRWSLMGADKDAFEFGPAYHARRERHGRRDQQPSFQEIPQLREADRRQHGQHVHGDGGRHRQEEAHRHAGRGHHRHQCG